MKPTEECILLLHITDEGVHRRTSACEHLKDENWAILRQYLASSGRRILFDFSCTLTGRKDENSRGNI